MRVNSCIVAICGVPVAGRCRIFVHERFSNAAEPDIEFGVVGTQLRSNRAANGLERVCLHVLIDGVVGSQEAGALEGDVRSHLVGHLEAWAGSWVQIDRHVFAAVHDWGRQVVPERCVRPLVSDLTVCGCRALERVCTALDADGSGKFVPGLELVHGDFALGEVFGTWKSVVKATVCRLRVELVQN